MIGRASSYIAVLRRLLARPVADPLPAPRTPAHSGPMLGGIIRTGRVLSQGGDR